MSGCYIIILFSFVIFGCCCWLSNWVTNIQHVLITKQIHNATVPTRKNRLVVNHTLVFRNVRIPHCLEVQKNDSKHRITTIHTHTHARRERERV